MRVSVHVAPHARTRSSSVGAPPAATNRADPVVPSSCNRFSARCSALLTAGTLPSEGFRGLVRGPSEHVAQNPAPRAGDGAEVLDRSQSTRARSSPSRRRPRPAQELASSASARSRIRERLEPRDLVERPPVDPPPVEDRRSATSRSVVLDRVRRTLSADSIQPRTQRRPPLEAGTAAPRQARVSLHQILNLVETSEHPVAMHPQLVAVSLNQRGQKTETRLPPAQRQSPTTPHPDPTRLRPLADHLPARPRRPARHR